MSVRTAALRFWWPLAVLLAAVAVSVGLACDANGGTERTIVITLATVTPTAIPTPSPTPSPAPTATPTPSAEVCGVNPDAAPPSVLQVQEPQPGQRVKNPLHVRGWGSEIGFENRGVIVALIDAGGNPLPLESAEDISREVRPESKAGRIVPPGLKVTDFTAPFATDILVSGLRSPTPFCLWVFLATTSEGIPRQVVQVPVLVTP